MKSNKKTGILKRFKNWVIAITNIKKIVRLVAAIFEDLQQYKIESMIETRDMSARISSLEYIVNHLVFKDLKSEIESSLSELDNPKSLKYKTKSAKKVSKVKKSKK